ncbi:MAG: germination protein YpeB [Firmicutes bacterium]|nr:germination protein YpeB [Bacillota bacterium]
MERHWRTVVTAAAILVVLSVLWGVSQTNARRTAERQLAASYQERFFDAVAHIENIEVLLGKAILALAPAKRSDELSVTLFSDLWRQAFAAQANLTQLPLLQGALMHTGKYLTQVGDFGYMLARKISAGEAIDEEDLVKLEEFRRDAAVVNQVIQEAQASAARGTMPWSDIRQKTNLRLARRSPEVSEDRFARLEKQAAEFPTIIYDGPFSDHVVQQKPKGLTGSPVSEERARQIAEDFMAKAQQESVVAEVVGQVDGSLPSYQLRIAHAARKGQEIARLDITRTHGHVVWMLNARHPQESTLTMDEAARKAKDFLVALGFEHIVPTYANQADGWAIIPFAPLQDGAIIYPDLIKVTVALDNGEIVGFEGIGYIMNHHDRDLPEPKITAEQALQSVSPNLEIVSEPQLALIPLETLEEVLTYEIKGRINGQNYVNYVDALSGELIRILQIIDTPEGPQAI